MVTTDVGPRILRFGFVGGENEFVEFPEDLGQTGGTTWRPYGGHRLWHAPEDEVRTYYPDNQPVECVQIGKGIRLVQQIEATTGIQKSILIELSECEARVRVDHHLTNRGVWPVTLAPWALSMMAPGGTAIAPLPPRGGHPHNLLPNTSLILWPYTHMSDPRWIWGRAVVMLRQDPERPVPQKVGLQPPQGWAAYANAGRLFVKFFSPVPGETYPDAGSSLEFFTNELFTEVETLGPQVTLQPGENVSHTETWFLFGDVPQPQNEADVEAHILPRIAALNY
jgi:hypothetical protein